MKHYRRFRQDFDLHQKRLATPFGAANLKYLTLMFNPLEFRSCNLCPVKGEVAFGPKH